MKIEFPWQCNYCLKQKTKSNNWFLRYTGTDGLDIQHWSDEHADDTGVEHICSQECIIKAVSAWMNPQFNPELMKPAISTHCTCGAKLMDDGRCPASEAHT